MSEPVDEVCLTLTLGPIRGLGDEGIAASYDLWNSMVAAERFPAGAGASGANYIVSVRKPISDVSEVRRAEEELTKALQMLEAAWPFSGGSSCLPLKTREVISAPCFTSNADELELEMLRRIELTQVTAEFPMPLSWSATYIQAPLCLAARIARLNHCDDHTWKLLHYHQRAVIERDHPATDGASWFISLYKVRDYLARIHGDGKKANGKKAMKALCICKTQWNKFGCILNKHYDLRHLEINRTVPELSSELQDNLYRMARSWVASHLWTNGIPAIGRSTPCKAA